MGLQGCSADPGLYVSTDGRVTVMIHVDDLLASGPRCRLDALFAQLRARYALKYDTSLDESGGELVMLGRRLRRTPRGFEVTGDAGVAKKLAEIVAKAGPEEKFEEEVSDLVWRRTTRSGSRWGA